MCIAVFKANQIILAETTSGAAKQEDTNPLLGGWERQSGSRGLAKKGHVFYPV